MTNITKKVREIQVFDEYISQKERQLIMENFELYYTELPEAKTNNLSIKGISRKLFTIRRTGNDLSVYIRFIKPRLIEYAVGQDENTIDENSIVQLYLD